MQLKQFKSWSDWPKKKHSHTGTGCKLGWNGGDLGLIAISTIKPQVRERGD